MKLKHYKSNHALEILTGLNDDRKKMKQYCDVTLNAESNDFSGHNCILSVFSTFFSKMFSIEMKEKFEKRGNIQGVTEETLEAVLNFIYTCDITITSENVYNLIEASNYMEVPHLKKFCEDFLLDEIDMTNCLPSRAYAKLYNLDKLIQKADKVIANNFENLIKEDDFNALQFDDIKEILEIEHKEIASEEVVFDGLIQWIKHDTDARRQHLPKLFSLVKLKYLSGDFLIDVVGQEDLIMSCIECAKQCFQVTASRGRLQAVPELPKKEKQFLAFKENQVWKYDITKKEIEDLPNMIHSHENGTAVCHKEKVFVISGNSTHTMERYVHSNKADGWQQFDGPALPTICGSSAILNGCIYNYGGLTESKSGVSYDIARGRWNDADKFNEGRSSFSLVCLDNKLYAVGGWNVTAILNTVECYDPQQGGWKSSPSMNSARQGLAAVVLNHKLYAIGGYNRRKLKSVEQFDPLTQTWTNVADMNFTRFGHGACATNGKIYVAGGGSPAVEAYDPERNIWEIEANIDKFQSVEFMVSI